MENGTAHVTYMRLRKLKTVTSKLYSVNSLKNLPPQIPIFYPFGLEGGEIVLAVLELKGFVKVFYCGALHTISREYLTVWES